MKTQPTQLNERIISIDVLRGFAVLGILIMNIQSFSMIGAAYFFPTAYGDFTGLNKWTWIFSHVLADSKFMAIFSMLFGAGVVLFSDRLNSKGIKGLGVHYRRMFWLLVIGLAHAYLLWQGDILVAYAICGLLVVLFRKKKPGSLLVIGFVFLAIASLIYLMFGYSMPMWPEESIVEFKNDWMPPAEAVQHELEIFRGSWVNQLPARAEESIMMQTFVFFTFIGWRSLGLMLVGMALYKWKVFSAQHSKAFYFRMAAIGLVLGLVLILFGLQKNQQANFAVEYSFFIGSQYNYWGSIGLAMFYIAVIMLLIKAFFNGWLIKSLKAVGQMAFTNYLLQTIICTFLFYGHGFGLYGRIERTGQILIVLAIWVLQMVASPIWLKYFKYGPFEWLWRSLTYWRFQPIKRQV